MATCVCQTHLQGVPSHEKAPDLVLGAPSPCPGSMCLALPHSVLSESLVALFDEHALGVSRRFLARPSCSWDPASSPAWQRCLSGAASGSPTTSHPGGDHPGSHHIPEASTSRMEFLKLVSPSVSLSLIQIRLVEDGVFAGPHGAYNQSCSTYGCPAKQQMTHGGQPGWFTDDPGVNITAGTKDNQMGRG